MAPQPDQAARVVSEISEAEVQWWKASNPRYKLARSVPVGTDGYVLNNVPEEHRVPEWVFFQPLRVDHRNGAFHPMFPEPPYHSQVLFPAKHLVLGNEKRPSLLVEGLDRAPQKPEDRVDDKQTVLFSVCHTWIKNIVDAELVEIGAAPSLVDFAKAERPLLVNTIIAGFKRMETFNLFKDRFPTSSEIWNRVRPYQEGDRPKWMYEAEQGSVVIYMIVYRWFEGSQEMFEDYCGKTDVVPRRNKDHGDIIEGRQEPKSCLNHYGRAREIIAKGGSWKMFPIICMPKPSLTTLKRIHPWAEQMMIALSRSYNPKLLVLPNTIDCADQIWSVKLAKEIYRITNVVTDHPKLNSFRRVGKGLNWSSPIMMGSAGDPTLWFGIDTPTMYIFKRESVVVRTVIGEPTKLRVHIGGRHSRGTNPRPFSWTVGFNRNDGWDLEQGDRIVPCFEILKDEHQVHPHSLAAMPTVGPFHNWHLGNILALRFEWTKNGETRTRYFHGLHNFTHWTREQLSDTAGHGNVNVARHMEKRWTTALSWTATLLRWRWDFSHGPEAVKLRSWRIEPWSARVRMVSFNFKEQKLMVTSPPQIFKDGPRLLSFDDTMKRLYHTYGSDLLIGLPGKDKELYQGPYPGIDRRIDNQCDFHYLVYEDLLRMNRLHAEGKEYQRKYRGTAGKVRDDADERTCNLQKLPSQATSGVQFNTCQACELLRRYCTFMPPDTLQKNYQKYKTLSLYARAQNPSILLAPRGKALGDIIREGATTDLPDDEEDDVGVVEMME